MDLAWGRNSFCNLVRMMTSAALCSAPSQTNPSPTTLSSSLLFAFAYSVQSFSACVGVSYTDRRLCVEEASSKPSREDKPASQRGVKRAPGTLWDPSHAHRSPGWTIHGVFMSSSSYINPWLKIQKDQLPSLNVRCRTVTHDQRIQNSCIWIY